MADRHHRAVTALPVLAALLLGGCASAHAGSAGVKSGSCDLRRSTGSDTVTLTTACPAAAGSTTTITITITNSAGQPVTGAAVTLKSIMPSMGMSSDVISALPHGDSYQASVLFGMSGTWDVAVTVVPPGSGPEDVRFAVKAG
jgi:hypothetical protein